MGVRTGGRRGCGGPPIAGRHAERATAARRPAVVPSSTMRGMSGATGNELDLADWRRRVARMYADVRFLYPDDPVAAWQHWRAEREALYREHPQSPVMP